MSGPLRNGAVDLNEASRPVTRTDEDSMCVFFLCNKNHGVREPLGYCFNDARITIYFLPSCSQVHGSGPLLTSLDDDATQVDRARQRFNSTGARKEQTAGLKS